MAATMGRITNIERLYNSVNGNPRYAITFAVPEGEQGEYLTSSDISDAYEVGNPGMRVGDTIAFTLTRAGRIANMWTLDQLKAQ